MLRRIRVFALLTMTMLLLGGCGNTGADLSGVRREGGQKTTSGGAAYWDGYGINGGREMIGSANNGGQYDTYGTRNSGMEQAVDRVGKDLKDGWEDVTDMAKDTTHKNTNSVLN